MELLKRVLAVVLCSSLMPLALQGLAEREDAAQGAGQKSAQGAATRDESKASGRVEYQPSELHGDQRILHALNRFTFGPRPGDLEAVRALGLEKWFDSQLHPENLDESVLNERLTRFPAIEWTTQELFYRLPPNALIRQAMNGKAQIPKSGALHAVYENQIYRMQMRAQEKKEAETPAGTQATAPAAQTPGIAKSSEMGGAEMGGSGPNGSELSGSGAMEPEAGMISGSSSMGTSPVASGSDSAEPGKAVQSGAMQSGSILSGMGQSGMGAESGLPADPSLIAGLLALPPEQRLTRLAAMEPQQFEALMGALKPAQRTVLAANLNPDQEEVLGALEHPQQQLVKEITSERLERDIDSNAQLQEVMTDFWLNHFNVYLRKDEMAPAYLVSYERDVVRPLALGKFEDLLEAVAHSPEMMLYLDNASSTGPDSAAAERAEMAAARRPGQKTAPKGLNENYARELMELHTLGVNGGYTQADVIQVARVLTGWTIDQPARGGGFVFLADRHEPGTKLVLGRKIKESGELEGRELLHLLATQPATARFLSRKLAVRFVSDDPPEALIERMAQSYLSSDGDISAVLKTLFHSPEFWSPQVYGAKVKTPLEFVVSAVRASGATVENYQPLVNALNKMGMPLYGCIPPTGYHWDAATWVSTAAMVDRMNFAMTLAGNKLPGIAVTWALQPAAENGTDAAAAPGLEEKEASLESLLLPGGVSTTTREAALKSSAAQTGDSGAPSQPVAVVAAAPGRPTNEKTVEQQDRMLAGILLGSPEFQRR
jgi:uncharacterized protein (DUF1800 family)